MAVAPTLLLLASLGPVSFQDVSAQADAAQSNPIHTSEENASPTPVIMTPIRKKENVTPPLAAKPDHSLTLGLAVRGRYDLRFNDRNRNGQSYRSSHLSYDTTILTAEYDSPVIFGAAQYRFYGGSFLYGKNGGYQNYPGEVNFPVYGYMGAKLGKKTRISLGITPVPFDDRWWGSSFLDSIGFIYGVEEVYNVGVSLEHKTNRWSFDLGFFPTTAPNAVGRSADSARYSVNISGHGASLPNGSNNDERYMTVGRIGYQLQPGKERNLTLTGSFWFSTIHNYSTHEDGQRRAFALSLKRNSGAWRFKLMGVRQDMDLRNPGMNDIVTVGDYDSPYNIATHATILFVEGARTIDTGKFPLKLDLFANYANVWKDVSYHAPNTQRLSLGAFWSDKATNRFRVWSEFYLSRNDPYIGAGQYTNGAAGGGDNRYKSSFLIIFGYYL